jgi:DNA-binding response OmpR family regulator
MSGRRRVLLLDDDTTSLEAATSLLEAAGFDVTISGRRFGRVDYIARLRPDMVILGVRLPYMAGDEVLSGHASHPTLKRIPVLVLSSCDPAFLEDLVTESGCAGFVRKGALREELLPRVRACLATPREDEPLPPGAEPQPNNA